MVLLGAQLSIAEAARVGVSSLPVMLGTLAICLGAAWLYGIARRQLSHAAHKGAVEA